VTINELPEKPVQCVISFRNIGNDTISISNVVPFGEDSSSVYITGKGPWGNDSGNNRRYNASGRSSAVNAFPKGKSPYGAEDLVGNVWQMTGDIYFNGTNYLGVIRGGSYYKPESRWWYIQGGAQPLDMTQILLLTSPGLDRSATVGFRCVKDLR